MNRLNNVLKIPGAGQTVRAAQGAAWWINVEENEGFSGINSGSFGMQSIPWWISVREQIVLR